VLIMCGFCKYICVHTYTLRRNYDVNTAISFFVTSPNLAIFILALVEKFVFLKCNLEVHIQSS